VINTRRLSAVLLLATLPLVVATAVVGHVLNGRATVIENSTPMVIGDVRKANRALDAALTVALGCWVAVAVAVAIGAVLMLLGRRAGRPVATGFGAALVILPLCCGGFEGLLLARHGATLWSAPLRGLTALDLVLNVAVVLVAAAGVTCAHLDPPRPTLDDVAGHIPTESAGTR
jgi:hypothetical protein